MAFSFKKILLDDCTSAPSSRGAKKMVPLMKSIHHPLGSLRTSPRRPKVLEGVTFYLCTVTFFFKKKGHKNFHHPKIPTKITDPNWKSVKR